MIASSDHRGAKRQVTVAFAPSTTVASLSPPPPAVVSCRGFKGLMPFFIFLSFPFWESAIKQWDIEKAIVYMGKIRKWLCMTRVECRLRKNMRRPYVYTSSWSLAQRQSTTIKKNNKNSRKKNLENPGEGENLDCQSYHIIRLSDVWFSTIKNHQLCKEIVKDVPFKGKKLCLK